MNYNTSISIIIPAYNVEKYLKVALVSIKAQTELPDEVILIDDGSTDGTLEVAKAFELSVAYQVLSIENNGQGNARNLGVSLASSEYVYFFDSDDFLDHDFIRKIKDRIIDCTYPDIVLFSGKSFFDGEYQGNGLPNYTRGFEGNFSSPCDFINKAAEHKSLFCQPCLYISKRELWGKGKLEFESNFLEDDAIFFPLIFSCITLNVMNDCFFHRRVRAGSTMTSELTNKHVLGALNCLETTIDLFHKLSFENEKSKKIILNKIENLSLRYISYSRRAGESVKMKAILKSILLTKSLSHALKISLFSFRLNESRVVARLAGWKKTP